MINVLRTLGIDGNFQIDHLMFLMGWNMYVVALSALYCSQRLCTRRKHGAYRQGTGEHTNRSLVNIALFILTRKQQITVHIPKAKMLRQSPSSLIANHQQPNVLTCSRKLICAVLIAFGLLGTVVYRFLRLAGHLQR